MNDVDQLTAQHVQGLTNLDRSVFRCVCTSNARSDSLKNYILGHAKIIVNLSCMFFLLYINIIISYSFRVCKNDSESHVWLPRSCATISIRHFKHSCCDWLNHTTWYLVSVSTRLCPIDWTIPRGSTWIQCCPIAWIWVNIVSFLNTIQTPICYVGCSMIANTWTYISLYIRNTAILENKKSVCIFLYQHVNTCDLDLHTL